MSKARILIAESEESFALEIKQSLEALNYTVSAVVSTGEQALIECDNLKVDLVLINTHLDGKTDGVQTAEEICRRFDLPIVYLATNTDKAILEQVIRS